MIRGKTATESTILTYTERIEAWLRCEKVVRSDFFEEAAILIRTGETEHQGRVQLRSMHPTENMVHCKVAGEVLGGEHHGWMILKFAPMQDQMFQIVAPEEELDPICVKTEMIQNPVIGLPSAPGVST